MNIYLVQLVIQGAFTSYSTRQVQEKSLGDILTRFIKIALRPLILLKP